MLDVWIDGEAGTGFSLYHPRKLVGARKGNIKMKFVLKSNTDILVRGFKFQFPSQTGMSVLPPFSSRLELRWYMLKHVPT
ncbi:MAG TPA: hypothetical protein DET40_15730 [Lentisphaeria bacterium]|nr:MAG: hypothetical protein A2X45_14255 [Lentisphaerae bacterium GWF2_50_93]HCE44990.1 hypothetical protein [Lentisphaeria bacterium]